MRSDDVQNVNYSNDRTDFENKSMVYNEMFKLRLTLSINLSAHEILVLIASTSGDGSDEPAHTPGNTKYESWRGLRTNFRSLSPMDMSE